jgi:hypothetical protein
VDQVTETPAPPAGAESQVTALYQAHATGLVRLAMLMLAALARTLKEAQ